MTVPLLLLAIGAVFAGWYFRDELIGEDWQAFWGDSIVVAANNHVLADMEHVPAWVSAAPTIVGLLGIALAYVMYMFVPRLPGQLAGMFGGVYRFLLNKWYFDELYDRIFVRPAFALARGLWHVGDTSIIDGIPNGIATMTADGSSQVVKLQTGSIANYAFAMLIGLVLLVGIFLLFR